MATYTSIFLAVTVLVATCSAAPKNNLSSAELSLIIPDECKGKGFCSIKPKGYEEMEDIINSLLPPHLIVENRLDDRIGGVEMSPESDWHNCPYVKKTESLYTYSNDNDSETDIIIQTKLMYQPVDVITCANDKIQTGTSQECFQDLSLSSFNMKTSCQTSTTVRRLLVFDPKTGEIKQKNYDVPCCCTCKITSSI